MIAAAVCLWALVAPTEAWTDDGASARPYAAHPTARLILVDSLTVHDLRTPPLEDLADLVECSQAALVNARTRSDYYDTLGTDHINRRAYLLAAASGRRLRPGFAGRTELGDGWVCYDGLVESEPYGRLAEALEQNGWAVTAVTGNLEPDDDTRDPGLLALRADRTARFVSPPPGPGLGEPEGNAFPWMPTNELSVIATSAGDCGRAIREARGEADRTGHPFFVLTMPPRGSDWDKERLALFLIYGRGRGLLGSPTTRRPGLVRVTDVCPTVLAALGVSPPLDMEGRAAWSVRAPAADTIGCLQEMTDATSRADDGRTALFRHLVGVTMLVACAALLLWVGGHGVTRLLAFALWLCPATLVLFPLWTTSEHYAAVVRAALFAAALVAAPIVLFVPARWAAVVAGSIAPLVIMSDQLLGAKAAAFSYFGYCLARDSRLYGIGNSLAMIVTVAAMLVVGALATLSERWRRWGWLLTLIPCVVIGAPSIGAKTGGLVAAAFGTTIAAALAVRSPWWRAAIFLGAPIAAGVVVLGVGYYDVLAHADPTTHWGQALKQVLGGDPEWFRRTMEGKVELVRERFRYPLWWGPVGTAAVFLPWVWADGPRDEIGTPPFAYVLAAAITSAFACLVNDSGLVITAMGCVPVIAGAALLHASKPVGPRTP